MLEFLSAPPPSDDEAHLGRLPHAMPLVAQRGEDVPYVRVLADRTGADLQGRPAGARPRRREVTGSEFPLRKVHADGWMHPQYVQAAEESWKRNAGDLAHPAVARPHDQRRFLARMERARSGSDTDIRRILLEAYRMGSVA
jgi:hypothetical protein